MDEGTARSLEAFGAYAPPPWGPLIGAFGHVGLLIDRGMPVMQALNATDPNLSVHLRRAANEIFGRVARSSELVIFAKGLYANCELTADERALLSRLLA